jgi:hypothetical protein
VSYACLMLRVQGWEDGGAYVLRGDELLPATEVMLGEAAHNAMLLSQGAERAIEMRRNGAKHAPADEHLPPAA